MDGGAAQGSDVRSQGVGRPHPVEDAGMRSTFPAGWAPKRDANFARGRMSHRESGPGKSPGSSRVPVFPKGPLQADLPSLPCRYMHEHELFVQSESWAALPGPSRRSFVRPSKQSHKSIMHASHRFCRRSLCWCKWIRHYVHLPCRSFPISTRCDQPAVYWTHNRVEASTRPCILLTRNRKWGTFTALLLIGLRSTSSSWKAAILLNVLLLGALWTVEHVCGTRPKRRTCTPCVLWCKRIGH
jgi:hypothetical protein